MRFIDIEQIELPDNWEEIAAARLEKLKEFKTHKERADYIDDHPDWKKLYKALHKLSIGKCWYTEAQDTVGDFDVDHFRPKNKAKNIDGEEREGYWWLAYDFENYRLSGQKSNRRQKDKLKTNQPAEGKSIYFPLSENSIVAKSKEQIEDEVYYLLDPVNELDVSLITFNSEGEPIPANPDDDWCCARVYESTDKYHLDSTTLTEARKTIWRDCNRLISEISIEMGKITAAAKTKAEEKMKFLRSYIQKNQPYSSAAIACLVACEYPWARRVLAE